MNHDIDKIRKNPKLEGQIGENAIWEGPLSKEGFPMGVGSSSGITPMQVSKFPDRGCEKSILKSSVAENRDK